jgi:glyoxylase-like metal-dependent hydrolase (beta-lactamase superfamily II)
MRRQVSRRFVVMPFFGAVFVWSYFSAVRPQPVVPVSCITTEEGQQVAFDKETYQFRELAKRLPIQEPWTWGPKLQQALQRFGLDQNTPRRVVPAEIATNVYLVGQDRFDNLTYMIDCGVPGVAIIDPTYDSEVERTVANVEKCGRSRKDIRWVLNTHCHVDHSMADKKFQEMGAEIILHEADAAAIEKGTQVTAYYLLDNDPELPVARKDYPAQFPRCAVNRRLSDGEELQLGGQKLQVIHTPGHTPGSVCFLLQVGGKKLLFSGDTVLYDYRVGWQGNPYADNRQYLVSLQKLANFTWDSAPMQWDVLLPGHGAMAMDKAYLDVEKARDLVEADLAEGKHIEGVPYATPEYRKRMYGRRACP